MTEVLFIVEEDPAGGYLAHSVGPAIVTQAATLAEVRGLVRDAVRCHFPHEPARPRLIWLHFVHDEIIEA